MEDFKEHCKEKRTKQIGYFIGEIFVFYLILINVIAFILFGIDKQKAKRRSRRISEATLLLQAAIGGSIGAWLGMTLFRHKTLHKKFTIGVPAIFASQLMLLIALFIYCR